MVNTNESNRIAREVEAFYDARPYPPPVEQLDEYRRAWDDECRRRADFHLYWPARPYEACQTVLVAGCGTSQAAKHALRLPECRVIGIDVSATSLQRTAELKRKYDLANLELHQLAIECVGDLNQDFDKIICTGVLHHLPDPDAGLRALHDVLKPNGAMQLMVYATYGRTGVYMLQAYCRQLGIGRSDADITDLAHTLMALPPGHPLAHLLSDSADFRRKTGLADALLHPQDRAFTVPQFFDYIDRAGLTFLRWVRQAPYLPSCGAVAQTPHADRLAGLSEFEQYSAVELLRGTMVRHSAIVGRNDRADARQPIRFDGEQWLNFIPMRLPQTVCVQKNLPVGASAVLINQSHAYSDLVLPIDEAQHRLFEAIDGKQSIAQMVDGIVDGDAQLGHHRYERMRPFIELLWNYDHIVFSIPTS